MNYSILRSIPGFVTSVTIAFLVLQIAFRFVNKDAELIVVPLAASAVAGPLLLARLLRDRWPAFSRGMRVGTLTFGLYFAVNTIFLAAFA